MSFVTDLICDFHDCDTVKEDLVWWESTPTQPHPWRRTTDGRHWCWLHSIEEINSMLSQEKEAK